MTGAGGAAPGPGATVEVGRVVRAHGLRGELVVLSHSEDPEVLRCAEQVTLDGVPGAIPHQVVSMQPMQRRKDGRWLLRVKLAGIDRRERADLWISAAVRVPAEALEQARGDDFYWSDLIGLRCRGADGEILGEIREIWPTPGHDVLVVQGPRGRLLIPAADEILRSVDLQAREIRVELPEDPDGEEPDGDGPEGEAPEGAG